MDGQGFALATEDWPELSGVASPHQRPQAPNTIIQWPISHVRYDATNNQPSKIARSARNNKVQDCPSIQQPPKERTRVRMLVCAPAVGRPSLGITCKILSIVPIREQDVASPRGMSMDTMRHRLQKTVASLREMWADFNARQVHLEGAQWFLFPIDRILEMSVDEATILLEANDSESASLIQSQSGPGGVVLMGDGFVSFWTEAPLGR